MAYVRTYNPRVRVGNWNEDIVLKEHILSDYLERKKRGELPAQRSDFMKQNILKTVKLSAPPDNCVHFGDVVMLVNRGMEGDETFLWEPSAISMNADVGRLGPDFTVQGPCEVSATRSLEPCVRTAFIITSVDGSPEGELLRYDQSFALRTTNSFSGELFLVSDHRTFERFAKKSTLQQVRLEETCSFLAHWKVLHMDPQERMEYEGQPIRANGKVLIAHCKTNQLLAVLGNKIMWTEHGKEYEVTAHTFLDSHKAERNTNHWFFITANPEFDRQSIIDRPPAECQPVKVELQAPSEEPLKTELPEPQATP